MHRVLTLRTAKISGRLFASGAYASACALRQSPNANGSAESRSALGSLYSRQHHSQTLRVCSVMFSWTFGVAPLAAAPRLLKGRSVGKALPHFLYLLRTANAALPYNKNGRAFLLYWAAHQSDASARIFCVLRRVFWSPQGHLVGDAASGRACILCASARSKERGASPQNLRTSAPFAARHCLSLRLTFYRSLKNTVIIGSVELLNMKTR